MRRLEIFFRFITKTIFLDRWLDATLNHRSLQTICLQMSLGNNFSDLPTDQSKDLLSDQMSFYGHPPRGPRVPFPPPGNYKTRSSCLIVISAPESSIPNLALRLVKVFYSSPLLTVVYNILSLI